MQVDEVGAGGREAMRTYLLEHLTAHMVASSAESNEHTCRVAANAVLEMIGFPTVKPPAMVSIDDRALTFTGEWPAIETLKAFKPWNKR